MNISSPLNSLKRSYFSTICSLYITMALVSLVLGFKVVHFGHFLISGAAFVLPFRYLLGDVLAEIYGYHVAKRQIWNLLLVCFVFSLIAKAVIALPSPAYWTHQAAFDFVLGKAFHVFVVASLGFLVGAMLNIYVLSRFRIMLKGRYFIIRSFFASIVGELTQYIIALSILYYSIFPPLKIAQLIFSDYLTQILFVSILTPFATILVIWLKQVDPLRVDSETIDFDPFKMQ